MELILYTREEIEETLSHGAILCTQEWADDYLMHYRVGGEVKGKRRWQNKDGSLTPEGYKHYAEMYGWSKKLNKAEKLQDRADQKEEKAESAARRSDEAVLKAYNATQKNERKSTARRQAKADKWNSRAAASEAAAAAARNDARKAQDKATAYADKLQRKEDRMSKWVNEDGSLNDKALQKYTYATGVPGERKMSLVGRIKFGNEYTKKFEKEYADKAVAEMKKSLGKDADDKIDRKTLEKEWFDSEDKKFEEARGPEYHLGNDPELQDLVRLESEELSSEISDYRAMSSYEKKQLGNQLLSYVKSTNEAIGSVEKNGGKVPDDIRDSAYDIQNKLINMIYDEVGSINAASYKPGTKAEAAEDKAHSIYQKLYDREEAVKSQAGFKSSDNQYSNKRLASLLEKDSTWKKLNIDYEKAEDDVMGAILDDLGFDDTPANRSILYQYGWWD